MDIFPWSWSCPGLSLAPRLKTFSSKYKNSIHIVVVLETGIGLEVCVTLTRNQEKHVYIYVEYNLIDSDFMYLLTQFGNALLDLQLLLVHCRQTHTKLVKFVVERKKDWMDEEN